MASMTRWGTCVPPGPSRNTAGCPFTFCEREGNCDRTHVRSKEVFTSVCIVDKLLFSSTPEFLGQRPATNHQRLLHRLHKVGHHPISCSFQSRIVLCEHKPGKNVSLKIQ